MSEQSTRIVGVGAGALDIYRPQGEVGSDFQPGKKIGWTDSEDILLPQLLESGCERHIGGNVLNTLAYLSLRSSMKDSEVAMVSALGERDIASKSIRQHLGRVGIIDRTVTNPTHLPSISIIERQEDRMVRGRPRTPLSEHLGVDHLAENLSDADIVVVASLKSADLARTVFANTPDDAFRSYNPGSSEFRDHPDQLQAVMKDYRPDLLALNDEELQQLFGAPDGTDLFTLADKATDLAASVLWTRGKDGIVLTQRLADGRVIHTSRPAKLLPKERVVDTLGAGDRAHAVAVDGIATGSSIKSTLDEIAESTSELIQHTGAHGDLYK